MEGQGAEKFAPDSTELAEDVLLLYGHNREHVLGRTSSNTLKVTKDNVGLYFECELPDTTIGNDVRELIRRRDLKGASFGFVPIQDDMVDGIRVVKRARIKEISLVSMPFYEDNESLGLRSRGVRKWQNLV